MLSLKGDVQPVQNPPCRVAAMLQEKIMKAIKQAERGDIIAKVAEHIKWISSTEAARKPGKPGVFIDLSQCPSTSGPEWDHETSIVGLTILQE